MRVKALLRRGPVPRSSVLRVADLEVDRLTQQVRRGGRRIELTPKEYALLEYLAANPGRVFSRTMIIEHVWDQSFEGLTNIVDVYVRHLRAKVDDPFPVKLIRTVRGVGYGLGESTERVNTRSLSFRLVAWYARRADLVFVLLGLLTLRVPAALSRGQSARHPGAPCAADRRHAGRARAAPHDEAALGAEVESLYSPEANDRFIRITRADGTPVYASGPPKDARFDPAQVPPAAGGRRAARAQGRAAGRGRCWSPRASAAGARRHALPRRGGHLRRGERGDARGTCS